jgi:predicted nucleic acid-binding protein
LDAMGRSVYVETSIISYLTAQPSRDLRAAAWQQITAQWWQRERTKYELYTSALVIREASRGDAEAARRRLQVLEDLSELAVDDEVERLTGKLIEGGGVPVGAEGDALHIAAAAVHEMDYLLTWNCRHIDNAVTKPIIRSICAVAGYACPEICTPVELLSEESPDV